jgi:hypothetical protein
MVPVSISFAATTTNASGGSIPAGSTSCSQSSIPNFIHANVDASTPNAALSNILFATTTLTFDVDMSAGSVSFDLIVDIDCSIIPMAAGATINLEQTWTSIVPITFTSAPVGPNIITNPIAFPYIISPSSQPTSFQVNYNNNYDLIFEYQNTSNSAEAKIDFQFSNTNNCNQYFFTGNDTFTLINSSGVATAPVTFNASGANWNNNVVIPIGGKLILKREISITGCVETCNAETAHFNWRCHDITNANYTFCEHCLIDITTTFRLESIGTNVHITRIDPLTGNSIPTLQQDWDNSCFGESDKFQWKYRIENVGTETLDNIQIILAYTGGQEDLTQSLTLVYENDVVADLSNCSGCVSSTAPNIAYKTNYSCLSPSSGTAIKKYDTQISNIGPGKYIDFNFASTRCIEQDPLLYNSPKFFNKWKLEVYNKNICGDAVSTYNGQSPTATINPYFPISTSNFVQPHLDLNKQFISTVSNVVVNQFPPPQPPPAPIPFHVDLISLFDNPSANTDEQIVGCLTNAPSTCEYKGYLRVWISTDKGLGMQNLSSAVKISKPGLPDWNPFYYNTQSPATCDNSDYYFYFDMSDFDNTPTKVSQFFTGGKLNFELTPCCVALSTSAYTILFDILPDPNQCYQFSAATDNIEPLFSSVVGDPNYCSNCGWIPLAEVGNTIDVQCPGCDKPGIEIKKYAMERMSLGLPDNSNDQIADNTTPIPWVPNSGLNTYYSNHGDVLIDRMHANIFAGSATVAGYEFSQVVNGTTSLLDVLQIDRKIPHGGPNDMNLIPIKFTLYIDAPANGQNCVDCGLFSDFSNGNYATLYETERIIQVDATNSVEWNKYVQLTPYNSSSDLQLFFTFSNDQQNSTDINLNSNVVYPASPTTFSGFTSNHQFRLVVEYNVCGNYVTTDASSLEDSRQMSKITNHMWLTGMKQSNSAGGSVPDASNFAADLPAPIANATGTLEDYVDNHLFWCTKAGISHYFLSVEYLNESSYYNTPSNFCNKVVECNFTCRIGGNTNYDLFPGEYRIPPFIPTKFQIKQPTNYYLQNFRANSAFPPLVNNSLSSSAVINNISASYSATSLYYEINVGTGNLSLPICLTSIPPPAGDWVVGDQKASYIVLADMKLDPCVNAQVYTAAADDILIDFETADPNYCASPATSTGTPCNTTGTLANSFSVTNNIASPNTNLQFTFLPPSEIASAHTVKWEVDVSNAAISTTSTDAHYVFLQFPDNNVVNYLNNWHVFDITDPINSVPVAINNNIAELASLLLVNEVKRFRIEADYVICQSTPVNFNVNWGWYCDGYPANGATIPVCQASSSTLVLENGTLTLEDAGKSFNPTSINACQPFLIEVNITATDASFYPNAVNLLNMDPELFITSVTISNCTLPSNFITLPVDPTNPYSFPITPNNINNLFNSTDGGYSGGQCLHIEVWVTPGCYYSFDDPIIELTGTNSCNQEQTHPTTYSGILTPGADNYCTSCLTITKTPSQLIAVPYEPVSFDINICNSNGGSATGYLVDYLPANFVVTSPNPCLWCELPSGTPAAPNSITFNPCTGPITVAGYYTTESVCANNANTAQVTFNSVASLPISTTSAQACITVSCDAAATQIWNDGESCISLVLPTAFNNVTISIHGTFTIDQNLTLTDCKVYMYPGAQIVLLGGMNLTLNNTTIQGCTSMWNRVHLLGESVLVMQNQSVIMDANDGLYAEDRSTMKIDNSSFLNNVRGIYVPPPPVPNLYNSVQAKITGTNFGMNSSIAFKPDYPGGQPTHGNIPFAGIEINDMNSFTIGGYGSNTNEFFNMHTGVVAKNSLRVLVQNSRFTDIHPGTFYNVEYKGAAIVSTGEQPIHKWGDLIVSPASSQPTIVNSTTGIYTDYSNLRASNITMTGMSTGVYSTRCTDLLSTIVTGCSMNASYRGIDWIDNFGAKFMKAEFNSITISGDLNGVGIMMQEANSSGSTANYLIRYNAPINITSASGGIIARIVAKAIIQFNEITVNSDNVNYPDAMGIGLLGGGKNIATCNTLFGTDPVYNNSFGLVDVNSANQIGCNYFDGTGRGMFFAGPFCTQSFIVDNVINDHYVGLQLSPNAIIGQQPPLGTAPYHGNRWTGNYSSGFGAVNKNAANPLNLSLNLFTINSSTNPVYETSIPVTAAPPFNVDNTGWFVDQISGNTFECAGSQIACDHFLASDGESDLFFLIVNDSTLSSDYIPETKAMSKQMLYEILKNDSALLASNILFQSFNDLYDATAVGFLYQSNKSMSAYGVVDSISKQTILHYDSMTTSLDIQLVILDSLHSISPVNNFEQLRQYLSDSLNYYVHERSLLLSQIQPSKLLTLDSAQAWNQNAYSNEIPLENEKLVNTAAIDYYKYGKDSVYNHEQTLRRIALQCPFSGGNAVYRARVLLSLINDTTLYTDFITCEQEGMYRQTNPVEMTTKNKNTIRIIPNPANEKAQVIIPSGNTGICYLSLYDSFGRLISTNTYDCSTSLHTLDLLHFKPGVYTVKVTINQSQTEIVKLIIAK